MNSSKSSSTSKSSTTSGKTTTRERILQAALICFSNKGYHQTTTDEIVAESGLGKGTLYRHFESKQDLFISLVDWFLFEVSEEISHAWTDDMLGTDKIQAMMRVFLDESKQFIPFFKITVDFWAQTLESERLQNAFWVWLQRYQQQFAAIIEEGIASGEFRPINSNQAALTLFATLDALMLYKTLLGTKIDLHSTVRTALDIFLDGLKQEGDSHVAEKNMGGLC